MLKDEPRSEAAGPKRNGFNCLRAGRGPNTYHVPQQRTDILVKGFLLFTPYRPSILGGWLEATSFFGPTGLDSALAAPAKSGRALASYASSLLVICSAESSATGHL